MSQLTHAVFGGQLAELGFDDVGILSVAQCTGVTAGTEVLLAYSTQGMRRWRGSEF